MDVFGTVVIVVSVVAAVVSVLTFVRAGRLYQQIGQPSGSWLDTPDGPDGTPREMIREEVRRILERGDPPIERNSRAESPAGPSV